MPMYSATPDPFGELDANGVYVSEATECLRAARRHKQRGVAPSHCQNPTCWCGASIAEEPTT